MDMSRYFWRSHTSPVQDRAPNMLFFSFALFDAKYLFQRKSHWATPPRATPVQRTVPRSEVGIGFSMSGFGIDIHSCASKSLQTFPITMQCQKSRDDINFIRLNKIEKVR